MLGRDRWLRRSRVPTFPSLALSLDVLTSIRLTLALAQRGWSFRHRGAILPERAGEVKRERPDRKEPCSMATWWLRADGRSCRGVHDTARGLRSSSSCQPDAGPPAARRAPGRTRASSDSSPITNGRAGRGLISPVAQRMPTAVGRSKAVPSLRRSAGARDGDALDRERDSRIRMAARAPGRGSHAPSNQGSRPYSRSGQHHRFGYLLEVPGVGRS